jgi:hypothetical protein
MHTIPVLDSLTQYATPTPEVLATLSELEEVSTYTANVRESFRGGTLGWKVTEADAHGECEDSRVVLRCST